MVAPTSGELGAIIDAIAVQLGTVDGLRVYKHPPDNIQEFPAAVVRDLQTSNHSAAAEYRATDPQSVYNLEVLILVDMSDDAEAYEELEKYVSANSPSSVKSFMRRVILEGLPAAECVRAEPRRRHQHRWLRAVGMLILGAVPCLLVLQLLPGKTGTAASSLI